MEKNDFEGKVHHVSLDILNREYEIEVSINNIIYLLKLHKIDYNLISKLSPGILIKFKGILDKDKKELKNLEDVWIKLA